MTGFDSAGIAVGAGEVGKNRQPLIIQSQKNRDWRELSSVKGADILPRKVQAISSQSRSPPAGDPKADQSTNGNKITDLTEPLNEDDEAMSALLGHSTETKKLILPIAGNGRASRDAWTQRANEEESFRADVASRPEGPDLEAYTAVPVEDFGAALLRGMGWKEGGAVEPRKQQGHLELLGLGAKQMPGEAEGKAAKGKRKVREHYNPVMLRNVETGEMINEEDLEKRKQNENDGEQEWRQRSDKNLTLDAVEKSNRRPKAEYDDRPSSHSRRRDRSSERGHNRSRRRQRSKSTDHVRHSSSRRDRSRSPRRSYH